MHGSAPLLPLSGVVVIEMATFVAGPSAGVALAQLGADVVRIDPLGGAVDINRWPVDAAGNSWYWTSLNRGKRSVTIDTRSDAGRDLVTRMICAPGADRGIFVDNAVGQQWASWPVLSKRRSDLIHVHIEGHRDGRPAVDYTVNAETGVPLITGPAGDDRPVNHALPAWDLLTGQYVVTAVLAALRQRDRTGAGAEVSIALADVALAAVAGLGWFSEARHAAVDRERQANHIYGSYGAEFATADGQHVMVVALTPRQWSSLVAVTRSTETIRAIETALDVDFTADEAARYRLREAIAAAFEAWFAERNLETITALLDDARVLWAPYRTLRQAAQRLGGPLELIDQPGLGEAVSAASPIRWGDATGTTQPASPLGADTARTLRDLAGVSDSELAELAAAGVIVTDHGRD
jgi:2-methylfumaryl-CoA isomerase